MRKLSPDEETRTCKKCGKTYILSKGFYECGDWYYHTCKKCMCSANTQRIKDNTDYIRHDWIPLSDENYKCMRCGAKMKRVAHPYKYGHWNRLFFVDKKWVKERPECIQNELKNE